MNRACLLLLLAGLAPLAAPAAESNAELEATVERQQQTIEQLIRRIEALEAERGVRVADAPPVVPASVEPAPLEPTGESSLPARDSFDEDELAGARLDNEPPPGDEGLEGFFPLRGTSTWLRLGGYAKLDAMFDSDDAGFGDMFIPSTIPVGQQSGQGSFNMHARQTRFTIEGRRETNFGPLRFLLQNDFFGSDPYGFNLRHAWGQLGNTYFGYGFSAFMDLDSGPDTLDFAGPGVVPFGRVTSIRQYVPLRNGYQLILAAEQASPELTSTIDGVQSRTTAPNLVVAMRREGESGHVQASALLRQLAYNGDAGRDEAMAGGVAISGSWGRQGAGYVVYGALAGSGIAAYVGDLLGLGLDGIVDDAGSLQALDEWGGWIGYTHPWNADWHSTVTWGRLYIEHNALLAPEAFRRSDYVAGNLIYAPSTSWRWGVELLYGKLQNQAGEAGDVVRLQTSLKYDFVR